MSNSQIPLNLLTVTATEIQRLYSDTALTAVSLVQSILTLIEKHNEAGLGLRALISVVPHADILERTRRLDEELSQGKSRGPLHGIPFTVKDSIATHPNLGLDTAAGSVALVGSRPRKNATVVDRLLDTGMTLIGKASLTELNAYKVSGLTDGWSPVGGQTLSAYVAGGIRKGDRPMGHSTPGGSSSGSAVDVSAGFAIVSLGAETVGSMVAPASRASLGVVPIAKSLDSVGGMARSPEDLALVAEVITNSSALQPAGYLIGMTGKWDGIRLGFLGESLWRFPDFLCEFNSEALGQMDNMPPWECFVDVVFISNTPSLTWQDNAEEHEFHLSINEYLQDLEHSKVHSLEELVEFNREHADLELPPVQSSLENSLNDNITTAENQRTLTEVRELAGPNGIDKVLDQHNLDAIAVLTDSPLSSLASAAGYPTCTMPLGVL
ncbi:hypothetical protein DPV78_000711 [Talaromyces pinophilus]|nr:hypothetical protein DPV78_000711 [Talaromyces pinophilus]